MKSIPTSVIVNYREFDREVVKDETINFLSTVSRDLDLMSSDIADKGIAESLTLTIYNGKALLTDGNHRLACALRLGIARVNVEFEFYEDINNARYKADIISKSNKFKSISKKLSEYLK